MLPDQYLAFSRSLVAVSVFASNILFWRESGYFAAAAEEKPLLHTWSLAVEEQFYILFPLAVWLVWRLGRRALVAAVALVGLASLGLSQYAAHASPAANFYLLPTRAWELMAGALCALALDRRALPGNDALAGLGLALILGAVAVFDETTPFPSLWALAPVGGTALIVLFARPGGQVARALSRGPVVAVGLVSYSAYLWHQPLFAFARIAMPRTPRHLADAGIGGAVAGAGGAELAVSSSSPSATAPCPGCPGAGRSSPPPGPRRRCSSGSACTVSCPTGGVRHGWPGPRPNRPICTVSTRRRAPGGRISSATRTPPA